MSSEQLELLSAQLDHVRQADRKLLKKRLAGLRRRAGRGLPIDRGLSAVAELIRVSTERRQQALAPSIIAFDEALPISAHVDEIERLLQQNQVLIVAGETGSGKTTQLPKLCLRAGRGVEGLVGVTQPRRIAARSIARRLSEELSTTLGERVGYQVRFDEKMSQATQVKLMTDGVLLAETQRDRSLDRYDTLIIDEAHERSLNIDFLLGYIKQLLPRRPDLKVIITSATIDTKRFARHFDDAPVVEVSGRSYPVEQRYRALEDDDGEPKDLAQGIVDAIEELNRLDPMADVLVFLPGERDIHEAADALAKRQFRHTDVLSLYARLGMSAQAKIFQPGRARRIILSTNVAETSLTVPRIRFVIDSGLARISRYSHRSKVQRLPIEPVSQASANQRAGRCGRLGPGVCVRLYSETDFEQRSQYTEPEIVRTNLATVILQMETLRLGQIEQFPFVDPPDDRLINDGYQLLNELGAIDQGRKLTEVGRQMARWPLDVRLARLLIAAMSHDCVQEALVICAVLAIADPRERPADAQQKADLAHSQWVDERSDFVTLLKLWADYTQARQGLSNRQLREWCQRSHLNFLRMREWADLHRQLAEQLAEGRVTSNPKPASYEQIHRAVVTAFIGQLGLKDAREYQGARNRRFQIFPGSGLFKKGPRWMVSAFLVETAKVYARINAKIEPEWAEAAGTHLLKRSMFDPYWSKRAGKVLGYERVTLFGLPLVNKRRIHFGAHEPVVAHRLLLLDGLARGQLNTKGRFLKHNLKLASRLANLEVRRRQHDLLVDDEDIAAWYGQHVPDDVFDAKGFERWRRQAENTNDQLLFMREADLLRTDLGSTRTLFPSGLELDGVAFAVRYRFEPGHINDGVTLRVPLHLLNRVSAAQLEWLVPGLERDKIVALIKSLPKPLRRHFVPVPDSADQFLSQADRGGSLVKSLCNFLSSAGMTVKPSDFDLEQLPPHLFFNVHLLDGKALLAGSRDLVALQDSYGDQARDDFFAQSSGAYHRDGLQRWDFGELPATVELGQGVLAYPAIVDQGESAVGVRLFDRADEADVYHRAGLARLLRLELKDKFRFIAREFKFDGATQLQMSVAGSVDALRQDMQQSVALEQVDHYLGEGLDSIRNRERFDQLLVAARESIGQTALAYRELLQDIIQTSHQIRLHLQQDDFEALYPWAFEDIEGQLDWLVYAGFVSETGMRRLREYPRYLAGIQQRIASVQRDPTADRQRFGQVDEFWQQCTATMNRNNQPSTALVQFRWLVEEYRVSLFAQRLKTPEPVSAKRLARIWRKLQDEQVGH